ncbi:MAG TPA: glycosyltransferase family 39 protein [Terracidiphilus sp.]
MLHKFYEVSDDSKIYGGLAKNLLLHARYAVTDGSGVLHDTLIRLPGYPLFLAACFRIFGMENYFSATCVQIAADLVACMLVAWLAWRSSRRMAAFQATLWLACLCPFTAIYSAEPLTESLTILCIALTMWALTRFQDWGTWLSALAFTFAVTFAALLRPDGALVGVAFVVPFVRALRARLPPREWHSFHGAPLDYSIIRKAIVCLLLALAPFAAWTVRNGLNFHVFQPVAPRYATDPGEPTWPGFQSWMKTWCLDFTSTSQIYWNMPGSPLDINQMPGRAFDNPGQREETAQLFSDYAANGDELSLALDARFAQLAADRIDINPFRYYIWLPLSRVADMLFRPRIENLPIDLDWWVYSHHWAETRFSWFYVVLNAFYFMLAVVGLFYRPRLWRWMLLYFILRCALLGTIEAPEARYTIEFFPMIFVLAGVTICRIVPEKETAADQFAAVTHH